MPYYERNDNGFCESPEKSSGVVPVYSHLWAKTSEGNQQNWHPLPLHLLDVAACADAVLEREPEATRRRMGEILRLPWPEARPWILLLVACHDMGKASPGFQKKWDRANDLLKTTGLSLPRNTDTNINHAFISQIALSELMRERGWHQGLADLTADAVGCHHGLRASPMTLENLEVNRRAVGGDDWKKVRHEIYEALCTVLKPEGLSDKSGLSGPDFMLLSGLTSFADWIGSAENRFTFGTQEDCLDLVKWWNKRRKLADEVLDSINWQVRQPLMTVPKTMEEVFSYVEGFAPRPLQTAMAEEVDQLRQPSVLLVEAPMGEGKTEAAFYAHLRLQTNIGHRGLYIALPTKATGNAMFRRTLDFLNAMGSDRDLDLQLVHGSARSNEVYERLRLVSISDSEGGGVVRAGEWFTHKKKALLSEYGVGTVDQALMTVLPVKHHFMRLWGLANRVVVFDEIHAYDSYTGTLLMHLIQWLLALGSSVILLSATLPPVFRRKLAQQMGAQLSEAEVAYPRLSIFTPGSVRQRHFESDPARRIEIRVESVAPDVGAIRTCLENGLPDKGNGLCLLNTVQRAQELYRAFPVGERISCEDKAVTIGKCLVDGTEVYLFHARFSTVCRQAREQAVLRLFGKDAVRSVRRVLIATQVAEQSLDLDFDLIVTDLAPVDLVLQRAGRLWRHSLTHRPVKAPCLYVAGLEGVDPPDFGKPLWWKYVYREDLLLRTWHLLKRKTKLSIPDEIDGLVRVVYEGLADVEDLGDRLLKAEEKGLGEACAYKSQAHQAVIGFPDDSSWNDTARYPKADEDEPGLHPTLVAMTRMGKESVTVVPVLPADGFRSTDIPDTAKAKELSSRSLTLSRASVVKRLKSTGVPQGWKQNALLRNAIPLFLDRDNKWVDEGSVQMDDELGLVYGMVNREEAIKK